MTVDGTDLVWQLGGTDLGGSFPDSRAFLAISDDDKQADPPPQPPPQPPPLEPEPEPEPDPEPEPEPEPGPPKASFMVDAVCEDGLCGALTGDPVSFEDTSSGTVRFRTWDFGDDSAARTRTARYAWAKPGFYEVTLRVGDGAVESTASLTFLVEAATPAGTCVTDASTRCLLDSRYVRYGSTATNRAHRRPRSPTARPSRKDAGPKRLGRSGPRPRIIL